MKLIYIHQYFNTPKDNGSTRSYEFSRRLVEMGHEVHIVTSKRDTNKYSFRWKTATLDNIWVHQIPIPYSNKSSFFKRILAFCFFLVASSFKVVSIKCDLVFATSTPLTTIVPGIVAKKFHKVPLVFEVRDVWPKIPIALGVIKNRLVIRFLKALEKYSYSQSDAIVALSPDMKRDIVEICGSSNKVAVIPNSSDIELFNNYERLTEAKFKDLRSPGCRYLVYTGTFGRVNGLIYLVKLAFALKNIDSNVKILLFGDGAEKQYLEEKASELEVLNDTIYFHEPTPKSELPMILSQADICANIVMDVPELFGNSANKFFDTLGAGKPILLNHTGWMKDLVDHFSCGIVTADMSFEGAAELLHQKLNDDIWLSRTGENAFALAVEFFNRETHALQLCQIFESVLIGEGDKSYQVAPGDYYQSDDKDT